MSYTEIYKFTPSGNPYRIADIQNSHRSAAAIWDIIGNRYIGKYVPTWSRTLPTSLQKDSYSRLGELEELKKVWALSTDNKMTEIDVIVLRSTFDNVICRQTGLPKLIEAFNAFEGETSLKEQSVYLSQLLKNQSPL